MTKTVSAWVARRNFGKLLDEVAERNQPIMVESHGRPKVAIVPAYQFEQMEAARERFFDEWAEIANAANVPEEEIDDLVDEAIREVREERRRSKAS